MVKIFAFLELEPRLNIKCGFNWAGKNEHFSKVSDGCLFFKSFLNLSVFRGDGVYFSVWKGTPKGPKPHPRYRENKNGMRRN